MIAYHAKSDILPVYIYNKKGKTRRYSWGFERRNSKDDMN